MYFLSNFATMKQQNNEIENLITIENLIIKS